jgi:Cdc6-like AAA superfamily ATPase
MDELLLNFLGREREKTVRIGERTCAMRLFSARETLSLRREIAQLDCTDEEERALRANAALLRRSLTEGGEAAFASAEDVENALSVGEINELVGLAPVKEYVFGLADNLQVQRRRAAAGFKTASLSMHMIFTGNPGTGKTTIARLVAKYLKAIGALKGGQLVEVTRADLVGRYTGHTAPLTNSVIESALGGVLFIDEAYSLYRGQQDSFGLEAIDTLVKGMEDHRDELVVILAGYTKEMEVFLTANSGLASRFPNKIEFPDYTADELLDITTVLAKGKGYRLAESCTFPLLGYYKRRQALDSRTAGNGRLARNTLEKAIFNQSRRLIAEPAAELDLIQPSDLEFEE